MYIVMIAGSPHRHGMSVLLTNEFIRGAAESGHAVILSTDIDNITFYYVLHRKQTEQIMLIIINT